MKDTGGSGIKDTKVTMVDDVITNGPLTLSTFKTTIVIEDTLKYIRGV